MKRLIAVAVLAMIIAGLFVTSRLTTEHYFDSINNSLESCRESFDSGDKKTAAKKAAELEKDWEKAERVMAIFINHEVLDEIGASVVKLEPLAETGNNSVFASEYELAVMLLKHMRESEHFSLFSIF